MADRLSHGCWGQNWVCDVIGGQVVGRTIIDGEGPLGSGGVLTGVQKQEMGSGIGRVLTQHPTQWQSLNTHRVT